MVNTQEPPLRNQHLAFRFCRLAFQHMQKAHNIKDSLFRRLHVSRLYLAALPHLAHKGRDAVFKAGNVQCPVCHPGKLIGLCPQIHQAVRLHAEGSLHPFRNFIHLFRHSGHDLPDGIRVGHIRSSHGVEINHCIGVFLHLLVQKMGKPLGQHPFRISRENRIHIHAVYSRYFIPALKSNGIADGRYDDRPGYLIQIQLPGKLPGSVRAIQLIPVNRPVDPQHRPRFRPRCHNYRELDHRFMSQLPCGNGKICPLPCLNLPSKYFCHPFYHLSLPAASLLLPPLFCSILKAYCIIPISL